MDPNVGFNSPAMDTISKSGFSSARILRRKKPTPSTRSRQNWSAKDHDFNPFRKAPETSMGPGPVPGPVPGPGPGPGPVPGPFGLSSDTFGTGVSGRSGGAVSGFNLENFVDTNAVSDELNKLSIKNNRAKLSKNISETEKFMLLETRDAMKQLNIDEGVDFRAVLKRELEKLNIGDDAKVFSETVITDHLKGLKIEETMASNCSAGENESADANSKETREAKGSKVEKGSARNEGSLNSFSSGITTQEGLEGDRCADQATSTSSASFISDVNPFPGIRNAFGPPLQDEGEENARASFSSRMEYKGMENLGFGALNLEEGLNGVQEQKKETAKVSRYRKRKGKVRKHIPAQSCPAAAKDSVFKEKPQANDVFVESYSPMDVSPYRDMLTDEVLSQQATVVSDQKLMHDGRDFSMESQLEASSDVREDDYDMRPPKEAEPFYFYGEDFDAQCSLDESVSDAETGSFKSATDHFGYSSDSFATAASDTETTYSSITGGYDDGVGEFNSYASWTENGDNEFHVAPSAAGQSQTLEKPYSQNKKKDRVNVTDEFSDYTTADKDSFIPSSPLKIFPVSGSVTSTKLPFGKGRKSDASYPLDHCKMKPEDIASSAARNAARELCEKCRLRGNQAYANGNLSEAENFYTEGVNAISESESCRGSFRALMLCCSNRAATRLSIGRINEALEDCMKAISIDPNFPRVHIRAANCYLALGEIENASLHFERASHAGSGIAVDEKLLAEASEGLQKAKKAREIFKLSAELLHRRKPDDTERALLLIDEALMLSPYSEELLIRKADALLMMQKYEDVIQFCKPNLITSKSESTGSDNQQRGSMPIAHRILFFAKAYFYLGRLENALDLLKNQELLISDKCGSITIETITSLAGTISELLRLKDAGNRAFQSGKHDEAVKHYTAAISWNVLSRPFTAICFCNRAAAYQALGQVTDALADCSLAIALDPNYLKPYSRRAALFEKIRDYRQAAVDLQRLVSLLTIKLEDASSYTTNNVNELKQTHLKLSLMEEAARREVVLNVYLILGVDQSATASEIKKAYRRAALKFHPDKAGQSLARSEGADDNIWRELALEVYTDADKLFKMIGEAYAILSDPSKRAQYDLEEEMKNIDANRERGNSIYGNQENYKSYPYGRDRWEEGRPYGSFYRWASHGSGSCRRYYS